MYLDPTARQPPSARKPPAQIDSTSKTASDAELLELAIERNATHGLQLSQDDKRDMARKIYGITPEKDRDATKKRLATVLSVSERTVRDWLSRIDKDSKEARDKRIFELWLACWTNKEIAEEVGLSEPQLSEIASKFGSGTLAKNELTAADHATEFDPPIYNIWKQQAKSEGVMSIGRQCVRIANW